MPPLLEQLTARQVRLEAIDVRLRQLAEPVVVDPRLLEKSIRAALDNWRGLLQRQTTHGRDLLRRVLTGPINFTPVVSGSQRGYRFTGEAAIDQLLTGVIELPTYVASPTGPDRLQTPIDRWFPADQPRRAA